MITVRYSADLRAEWDDLVRRSKNGTFLFERDYMEYHRDRFADLSFVVRDTDGRAVALFPASVAGDHASSHAGLTYGGLVLPPEATLGEVLRAFAALLEALRAHDVARLTYKTVPSLYHRLPSEEDRYALFRSDARLVRRDVLSAISLRNRGPVQTRRRRAIEKARKAGITVGVSSAWAEFWDVLTENLLRRYNVRPVHSLDEIVPLASRFPEHIVLATATLGGQLMAGVVVYLSPMTVHVQYPGVSAAGMEVGALDAVHAWLIERYAGTHAFYDFGASTESDGRRLNTGLAEFKEGFGARSLVHDFYDVDVTSALERLREL